MRSRVNLAREALLNVCLINDQTENKNPSKYPLSSLLLCVTKNQKLQKVNSANGLGALMTAQRARVPILFSAGRTPLTESGSPASRNAYIHNEMTALLQ